MKLLIQVLFKKHIGENDACMQLANITYDVDLIM